MISARLDLMWLRTTKLFWVLSIAFLFIKLIGPGSVWAQYPAGNCGGAAMYGPTGMPPCCNSGYLCYSSEYREFCCFATQAGCQANGDLMGLIVCNSPNPELQYDYKECSLVNDFLKASGVDESLSYVAVLRACVNMGSLLNQALGWAALLGGISALLRLAIGFIQYAMSTGDPTKLEEARGTIVWAVTGLLLIGVAYAILRLGVEFVPESWRVWFGVR